MTGLLSMPAWYFVIAVLVAAYQAARGARFQWIAAEEQNREAQRQGSPRQGVAHIWSRTEIIVLRCVADAILYFVSSAAGFIALLWAFRLLSQQSATQEISGGTAAVVVFLGLFGVLGVSGQLPHLLQEGKFPK